MTRKTMNPTMKKPEKRAFGNPTPSLTTPVKKRRMTMTRRRRERFVHCDLANLGIAIVDC